MPRLECTIDHLTYNNKVYGLGDVFATVAGPRGEEDARLLKGFGKAKDAPQRNNHLENRSLQSASGNEEAKPQDEQQGSGKHRRRQYDRRDMQARD